MAPLTSFLRGGESRKLYCSFTIPLTLSITHPMNVDSWLPVHSNVLILKPHWVMHVPCCKSSFLLSVLSNDFSTWMTDACYKTPQVGQLCCLFGGFPYVTSSSESAEFRNLVPNEAMKRTGLQHWQPLISRLVSSSTLLGLLCAHLGALWMPGTLLICRVRRWFRTCCLCIKKDYCFTWEETPVQTSLPNGTS